jgi:D-alanyl-D-alanine carboxypeptidase/D-alanyl-D-alanine-endopeptidase (penicillin-binding protein 4)
VSRAALCAILLVAWGCASQPAPGPAPARPPAAPPDPLVELRTQPFSGAQWGILAVDLATGDTLLARDADRRLIPASTMKLLTAATALEELGPDFRWETGLWVIVPTGGPEGVLNGDVVVTASGDPTLSSRWWTASTDPLDTLAAMFETLRIRQVTGSLVIDASAIDSTGARPSWMIEDVGVAAGAAGGAFALEEGETRVEVRGGFSPGEAAAVQWWPRGQDGFVRSLLRTTTDTVLDVTATWLPESRILELTGSVPAGLVDTLVLATRDPTRQAAAALHRAITARGVTIDGGWRVAWTAGEPLAGGCAAGAVAQCPRAELLRTLSSPPLMEVVAATLGPSQNWVAEQIARTLGGSRGWAYGIQQISDHIQHQRPVDPRDVRVADASGLSVQNLLSARSLVAVLGNARAQPWGEAFRAALAEPGEEKSTLETRLLGLEGRLFAKSGTLTNVTALAGYLIDDRNREIAFAVMVNGSNLPGATVRAVVDRIVRSLASGL